MNEKYNFDYFTKKGRDTIPVEIFIQILTDVQLLCGIA